MLALMRWKPTAFNPRKRIKVQKEILHKEPGTLTTHYSLDELLNPAKQMGHSTLAKWRARLPNGGVLGLPQDRRGL